MVFTAPEQLRPLETPLFTAPEPPGVPGALQKRRYLPLRSHFGLLKHRYLPLRRHFVLLKSGFLPYRSLQALRDTPKITKKHETSKNIRKSIARQSSRMLLEINMKMQNPEIPDTPKNPRTPFSLLAIGRHPKFKFWEQLTMVTMSPWTHVTIPRWHDANISPRHQGTKAPRHHGPMARWLEGS